MTLLTKRTAATALAGLLALSPIGSAIAAPTLMTPQAHPDVIDVHYHHHRGGAVIAGLALGLIGAAATAAVAHAYPYYYGPAPYYYEGPDVGPFVGPYYYPSPGIYPRGWAARNNWSYLHHWHHHRG